MLRLWSIWSMIASLIFFLGLAVGMFVVLGMLALAWAIGVYGNVRRTLDGRRTPHNDA